MKDTKKPTRLMYFRYAYPSWLKGDFRVLERHELFHSDPLQEAVAERKWIPDDRLH